MAIIYTYPIKTTLADGDLILISDSADVNKTKNATVTSIKDAIDVVDSLTATLPLLSSSATGSPDLSISGISGYGTAGQVMRMNAGATALEWATVSGGSGDGLTIYNDGSGIGLNITKLDFIGSGVSAAVDANDNARVNVTISGGGSPDGSDHDIQYKNGSAFAGTNDLRYHPTQNELSVKHTVIVKGQGSGNTSGRLKLNCEQDSHAVTLEGPAHSGGADYTLKFPSAAPANNEILEYTTAGNLGWIATPSGSSDTNIANTQLQLDNNRTLDFYDGSTSVRSLSFIRTNGGSVNMFKFWADGGTAPTFTVGNTESSYEGYVVIEGNGSNRTGQVQFQNAAGDYHTGIQATPTQAANITYTLPAAQAAAGEFLKNDGTGVLSWGQAASYESGTWIPQINLSVGGAASQSSQGGDYVKIGDFIFANFYVNISSAGYGVVTMSGLPFAAEATNGKYGTVQLFNNADGTGGFITHFNSGSVIGSNVFFKVLDASGTLNEYGLPLTAASSSGPLASGDNISGTIIYKKA